MRDTYEKARAIFIENLGSRGLMLDNHCLQEYEQFKVPKEVECLWKDECIADQFDMNLKSKLQIIHEFESILNETIREKDLIPDQLVDSITRKYGIEPKRDFTNSRLNEILNEVRGLKELVKSHLREETP
ncbi:MAG TPA: hypothetical protein GX523_12155 [Desulfitobacterium dehalogenans]|uniref:Uncharacterized protein n=1 Tax=Desulfitobacterium dehalogenans TaxID=36854 RepID=A0A7C6Z560_9FIRM|nr:hypothetical protein [Desulfitobacterium dehalogenans]